MIARLPLAAFLALGFGALAGAQTLPTFARGNLAAVLLDTGVASPVSTGYEAQIVEFARVPGAGGATSAPLHSVNTGVFLSGSGGAFGEGQIMVDGGNPNNLYFGGYTTGGASVPNTSAATNPRRAVRYDWTTGTLATTSLGANDFSGSSIRSVVSVGDTLLAAGGGSGTSEYGVLGGSTTPFGGGQDLAQLTNGFITVEVAQNLGGTITFSSQSSGKFGIWTLGSNGVATSILSLTNANQIFDFHFTDSDTLYYTDASASFGGVYRSVRGGDGKFAAGTKLANVPASRSLAFDGTTLFATTNEVTNNRIVSFGLDGADLTTVATAGTGRVFRGVEVVPEPGTFAALGLGLAALARRRKARRR